MKKSQIHHGMNILMALLIFVGSALILQLNTLRFLAQYLIWTFTLPQFIMLIEVPMLFAIILANMMRPPKLQDLKSKTHKKDKDSWFSVIPQPEVKTAHNSMKKLLKAGEEFPAVEEILDEIKAKYHLGARSPKVLTTSLLPQIQILAADPLGTKDLQPVEKYIRTIFIEIIIIAAICACIYIISLLSPGSFGG